MTENDRAARKAERKRRKAERKQQKDAKKQAREAERSAAGKIKAPPLIAALARCDDEGLEPFLEEHLADRSGLTSDRLRMVRDLARLALAASPGDDEAARARLNAIHAVLHGPSPGV